MMNPCENMQIEGSFTIQCSNELGSDGIELFRSNNALYLLLNNELFNFIPGFQSTVSNALYFHPWSKNLTHVHYELKGFLELTDPVFTVAREGDGWYQNPGRNFSLHFSNYLTQSDMKFLIHEAIKTGLFAAEEHFKTSCGPRYNSAHKDNNIEQIGTFLTLNDFKYYGPEPMRENIIIQKALDFPNSEEILKEWFQAYLDNEEIPQLQKVKVLLTSQVLDTGALYKKDDDLER